jgi:aminoglycoside 3-N-acetyltransferase
MRPSENRFGFPTTRNETVETEISRNDLVNDLKNNCGLKAGDVLIVHSSLKSLGPVAGGPQTVIAALQDVLTPEGTLLMPLFSKIADDRVFRMASTPSRTGLITETFRTTAGVLRSRNPTHSVGAWGKRAAEFIADHEKTSALGADSPFHKAAKAGADVLMIGTTLTTTSLVHVAEAIVRVPYLGKWGYTGWDLTLTLIDFDGSEMVFPPKDAPAHSSQFTKVQDELERRGHLLHCKLGQADSLKFSGVESLDIAVELLRADPTAMLCHEQKCPVCPQSRRICEQALGR